MKRTQLRPHKKTFWVKRDKEGKFDDVQEINRCIRQDMAHRAKTKAKPGQKFAGD
ncbi:MAG: hypothetical protein PHT44_00240 [Candidatus Portnoybacteria bacterium]|nr:hypothetical protein [Candidatus Portnoybacteria bacterium]MDD4982954.1 hypothetical protein [Candidatus Portnoybacteria bacterium]